MVTLVPPVVEISSSVYGSLFKSSPFSSYTKMSIFSIEWSSAIVPSTVNSEPYFESEPVEPYDERITPGFVITKTGAVLSMSNWREFSPEECPALSYAITESWYLPSGNCQPFVYAAFVLSYAFNLTCQVSESLMSA